MSGIEWTERTWNPVRGCSRVSEGCRHCYAERVANRFAGPGERFQGYAFAGRWTGRVELIPSKLDEPLRWRKPARVFVNSMSDLFHEALSDEAIEEVFVVMALARRHTFQVLTKRTSRMRAWFTRPDVADRMDAAGERILERLPVSAWPCLRQEDGFVEGWPLPNVWLGVSVEDQKTADERIPLLLQTPAAARFISYEPALGPVDFTALNILHQKPGDWPTVRLDALRGHIKGPDDMLDARLDWVIVGGESGPGARPFDVAWARSVVRQCREAGVACFVKQLGARPFADEKTNYADWLFLNVEHSKGGDPAEWPEDLRVREFPSEAARG